ncbi:hypothetical protein RJ639_015455 [Escallonia herrerae]|uniref:DEAD-box RNA helicase Q domain-containing protein n=1 Tax=Escallonia herrerae TaxID=1293975 RepID=A0AA89AN07_9ASTE|nr:hypothetical protein RJ639_015455 [Escallonia herrerae]
MSGAERKIQSVFELSDGSGLAVTVARYETPAHTDIDKVGVIPDYPLPASFPKDVEGFCGCLQDPASGCYLNRAMERCLLYEACNEEAICVSGFDVDLGFSVELMKAIAKKAKEKPTAIHCQALPIVLSGMSQQDVAEDRKSMAICVSGFDVPRPIKTFEDSGFSVELMKAIAKQAYEKPMAI